MRFKKLHPEAVLPTQNGPQDAGYDLTSIEDVWVSNLAKIRTGVAACLPDNHVGLILDRSGNAAKFGLTHLAGVADASYRGELHVLLTCVKPEGHQVKKGDRIAQLVVVPCVMEPSKWVDELSETQRGEQGFGSTGR